MAEEQTPNEGAAAAEAQNTPQFVVQKIYTKDVSFEVPNAPRIFQETGEAQMKINLAQRVDDMGENLFEVVQTVTVTAEVHDNTAYLAEVHQAGIFHISGFTDEQRQAILNTMCPHTLYPYSRRQVTEMILHGGFPPINMQPVNWDQLYAQRLQEAQAEAAAGGEAAADPGVGEVDFTTKPQ